MSDRSNLVVGALGGAAFGAVITLLFSTGWTWVLLGTVVGGIACAIVGLGLGYSMERTGAASRQSEAHKRGHTPARL